MTNFSISHLDHVAIIVKDMEQSAMWYIEVLGLKRYDVKEWGPYPIFLLAGKTGIALFPADPSVKELQSSRKHVRIDHFAFNLENDEFKKAIVHYDKLKIDYTIQDHVHFHSIYTKDPDGHTVELTTLISNEDDFY